MLQPVASSEAALVTLPPICAAVMLMPSLKKPVCVHVAAEAGPIVEIEAANATARAAVMPTDRFIC
jgi:hypothetical protein